MLFPLSALLTSCSGYFIGLIVRFYRSLVLKQLVIVSLLVQKFSYSVL
jgi:hypothetical protein